MSRRYELTDEQWNRIESLLPGQPGDPGGQGRDNRLFVNAVIWVARTGAPWRDLPARFGLSNSVFQRFNRWTKSGVWGTSVPRTAGSRSGRTDARFDSDSCSSACGGSRPQKESHGEALGRSRGGFSSKLHVAVDAQGQPVELCLGPGQEHDITRPKNCSRSINLRL